jgi:hypothetical protein
MRPNSGDPELLEHYSVFVYPFLHHLVGRRRPARLAALEPRWAPWATRFAEADLAAILEATRFFLPYIRSLLYPDVARLMEETQGEDHDSWAEVLRGWCHGGLGCYAADLPAAGVIRLTLRPGLMGVLQEAVVVGPDWGSDPAGPPELPVRVGWIDALLFPSGLGFLQLHARLRDDRPRLSSLIRLNQAFRHVHAPFKEARMPVVRLSYGEELTVREVMNFLTQGLAGAWDVPEEERGFFPAASSRRPADGQPYTDTEAGRAYGERCYLLCCASVDLAGSTAVELPAGEFGSAADRIVFEMAACIGLGESVRNPVWAPTPEQAARLARDNRIALWKCWTGMVLKEAVVFLGTEDLSFNRRSLPRHVENDYLPLYLFALYQKLQLFTFSTDLMREVAQASGRLHGARALAQRFVTFRSQYWFSEATRKPQGGELYRTFHRGLEVQGSFELVTDSIKDVRDYYEGVWARRVQWFKDAVTFGGPATVALGMVRMFIGESGHWWEVAAALAAVVALLLAGRAWAPVLWRHSRRAARAQARTLRALPRLVGPARAASAAKR